LGEDEELAIARLSELQARAENAVSAHSAALKAAAKAGWPDDLTEAAERSLATADEIHRQMQKELDLLERIS